MRPAWTKAVDGLRDRCSWAADMVGRERGQFSSKGEGMLSISCFTGDVQVARG